MKRGWPGARHALRAAGCALLAAALLCACAEAGRVTALEQTDRAREDRLHALEQQNAALLAQARALAEQVASLNAEHTRLSTRVAEALELAIAPLNALAKDREEQGRRLDALQSEVKTARATQAAPRAPESAECRWLGRRAIVLLLRDDTLAAQGFIRVYADLSCPIEHFAQAFGCAVPAAAVEEKQEARIEQCWANPRGRR